MKILEKQKADLDTSKLFRMPWTSSDNAFSWLEITRRCNLNCDYCYQKNLPDSDKNLLHVESDLRTLARLRRADTLFISGGEPLLHPQLESIIKMVRPYKLKPVLVTNGHVLSPEIVRRLKKAGLFGFVFHVDRGQSRPGWCGKSEKDLNRLRQQYADMACAENLICAFNTTILPETLHEVPDIIQWTIGNIHKVCTNSLIPVRVPGENDPWDLYVGTAKIDYKDTVFPSKKYKNPTGTHLSAKDIYAQIQNVIPKFQGNAYLGGTEVPEAPKWLFCNIIGTENRVFGTMGPRAMEILQNGHHFLKGRFLSFLKPGFYSRSELLLPLALFDKEIRKTLFSYLGALLAHPLLLFEKMSIQSILVLQPQDVLPSGKQDLCDGCPNKTV
ncbi:MAG: radical SAM protein, partial [Desulfobacterales bacterium]|nr:radical SAM protein [Desulfobacterales bacterium]